MEEEKKAKQSSKLSALPPGLREIADIGQEAPPGSIGPAQEQKLIPTSPPALPLPAQGEKKTERIREKTPKELELDSLIAARQQVIDLLKQKNPLVAEARKKIASLLPIVRSAGASHTLRLAAEAERIEFSIATSAYTPKKEKELLKRLRQIRQEIERHKDIDSARRQIEEERKKLRELLKEVRQLEGQLADLRAKCEKTYAEVLAERKAAYEERKRRREELQKRRIEELKRKVREEKKKQYEAEIQPYLKNYDDTVSMSEIVEIEEKGKKKEKKGKE
ncbi:MAG: hypothetical protein N3G22_00255 [Candidatus Micrarchaeota archaeon]|nr:hypothetical protein [Candidatus Micrarchaeota archaeon]